MKYDIQNMLDTLQMSLIFNNQNNIFLTILIIILTKLFSSYSIDDINEYYINNLFKKRSVCLDGKTTTRSGEYTCRVDNLFSDRFKALWYYNVKNIKNNDSIYEIKEYSDKCRCNINLIFNNIVITKKIFICRLRI